MTSKNNEKSIDPHSQNMREGDRKKRGRGRLRKREKQSFSSESGRKKSHVYFQSITFAMRSMKYIHKEGKYKTKTLDYSEIKERINVFLFF